MRMGRAGCLRARRGVAAFARIRYNGEKPGRSPAMILSGKEIQRHMGKDIVIQPFDPKRLARGRAGQVANGAFRRRGLLRAASPNARAQVWQRQGKVSPAFSKAAVGKAEPYGLTRRSRKRKAGQRPHGAGARWAPFSADRAGRRDRAAHRARPGRGGTLPVLSAVDSPGSGQGGTLLALSTSKTPLSRAKQ